MLRVILQGEPAWGMPPLAEGEGLEAVLETRSLREVSAVLKEVETRAEKGCWCAGFVAYEAAPAFDRALATHPPANLPLVRFGVFRSLRPFAGPCANAPPPLLLTPYVDAHTFERRVTLIKEAIARGETYQVNFSFPLTGTDEADPTARFTRLLRAQRCRYGALIECPDLVVCSASPELFFQREGTRIICRPMKGTAPRGRWDREDEEVARRLAGSTKDRAENIMIVDMIRNDLGRIAQTGSVRVDRLFEVERLPTVWQMTSTVSAETRAGLPAIFAALFPCASVTGAPKIQTTRLIRDLEVGPRGVYTGAVGFVGPGRRARFNVAIRTLVRLPGGFVRYDVGSGIVWDSDPAREYAECLAKARVLVAAEDNFDVITSGRWEPSGGLLLWERHLERLCRACAYFDRPFDAEAMRAACERATAGERVPRRLRIAVGPSGELRAEIADVPSAVPSRIALAPQPIDVDTPFVFHKTTRREMYETFRAAAPDADDVLLWNAAGELTETTIANVAFHRRGRWVTPPVHCGLLAGVMRESLLAGGEWIEGIVYKDEIVPGEEIEMANAVRGRWRARLI